MEDLYRSQFRLPYSLYEHLKEAADRNHRSVNAELVARLESTFPRTDTPTIPPRLAKTLADIDGAIDSTRLAEIDRVYEGLRDRLMRAVDEAIIDAIPLEFPRPTPDPAPKKKPRN